MRMLERVEMRKVRYLTIWQQCSLNLNSDILWIYSFIFVYDNEKYNIINHFLILEISPSNINLSYWLSDSNDDYLSWIYYMIYLHIMVNSYVGTIVWGLSY